MKRIFSTVLAASVLLSVNAPATYADDTPKPVDLPDSIYQQLLEKCTTDANEDGVITEEEYCNSTYINLDLDSIDSVDFLKRLKQPKSMFLCNGSISDFSFLSQFRTLSKLQLSDMPNVTDISFAKDMNLMTFYAVGLEQITDEQKIDIMKFHDADTSVGYSDMIGATPTGMFTYEELTLEIADTSVAVYDAVMDNPAKVCAVSVFGKSAGSTEYVLKLHDKEIHRGRINVAETSATVLPSVQGQSMPQVYDSTFYSSADKVILKDGTLYRLKGGKSEVIAENTASFDRDYTYDETGEFITIETILYNDGTVEVNGEKVIGTDGLHFKTIGRGMCITDSGDVYSIHRVKGQYMVELIYNGFSRFLENSSMNFISDTGELVQIELKKDENTTIGYQAFATGIMNVTDSYHSYFIDENKVLWEVVRRVGGKPSAKKCAEDVVFVGYRHYSGGNVYGCVHITSDGTAYRAGTASKVVLSDDNISNPDYKTAGRFVLEFNYSGSAGGYISPENEYNYHLTNDNVLCLEYDGNKAAFADVDSYIAARKDDNGTVYAYFMTTDGSIWQYCFETKAFEEVVPSEQQQIETISGDVDMDGKFDVSDVITLQKWLLGVPDTKLKNWKESDFSGDGRLDVFDLCLMKKELIK